MRTPHTPTHYRPDIDGLRAIAVLGVVLYHAGASFLPGGFVGVDVFFVISGFLITAILLKQMNEGTLSIKTFYERRIRRIMPALFVMMGVVLVFGIWRMTPWDLKNLAGSAKYAVCSIANIFFSRVTSGYFAESVDSMPLLHTWSLGVEEQFYVFFPLLLILAMRLGWNKHRIEWLLACLCVASFGLCLWRMPINASDCFYLLPYRSWELTIGALLALRHPWLQKAAKTIFSSHKRHAIAHITGITGLALILCPMFLYQKSTPFPGVAALAPCLGAGLVIAAGTLGPHVAGKFLSLRPLVFMGLISYSIYLWHWPMLVFQNYLHLNHPNALSVFAKISVGCAALPAGYLSWRFVEQPFRSMRLGAKTIFGAWLMASILLVVGTVVLEKTNGLEWRIPEQAHRFLEYKKKKTDTLDRNTSTSDNGTLYGDANTPPSIALWGDSHALSLAHEIGEMAKAHEQSLILYWRPALPPMAGFRHLKNEYDNPPEEDYAFNIGILDKICRNPTIKKVILCARWSQSIQGNLADYGPAEKTWGSTPTIATPQGHPFDTQKQRENEYAKLLKGTISKLREAGKTVCLIYPIPEVGYDVPTTLAREVMVGNNPEKFHVSAQKTFFERQHFVLNLFDSLENSPHLIRIKPHLFFLKDGSIVLTDGMHAFYSDSNHLSLEGAHLLRPMLEKIFTHPSAPPPATQP